jgi:Ca2+-binding RTX toxin-like protein
MMFGNAGDNILKGNGGDDHLEGRAGSDRLEGGTGNDFETGAPATISSSLAKTLAMTQLTILSVAYSAATITSISLRSA